MRSRALRRWLLILPLLLAATSAAGFAWFVGEAGRVFGPPAAADGIVVLTGGVERVATALRLLADGRGSILLVSGVGGSAGFADLARLAGVDVALDPTLRTRVTLGRAAASTRGNAEETALWARDHRLRSLIVVTANYHMPRALAELSRALPEVQLRPAAVQPPMLHGLAAWRVLAGEYGKWLVSQLGLSGYGAWIERPAAGAGSGAGEARSGSAVILMRMRG